jgi:hypothetical protein
MKTVLASALVFLGCLAGCNPDVGRPCTNPTSTTVPVGGALVASPALECESRLCLIENQSIQRQTCTEQCTSTAQCQADTLTTNSCSSGFVCAVATVVGSFKCRMLCVCKDDLVCGVNRDGAGNVITPPGCPNPSPTPSDC